MPESFRRVTVEQFAQLLRAFPFKRQITAVHLHHTWRPNHAQWNKHGSKHWIQSMANYHAGLGWGTIAQHLTIDPDGVLWTGRDWNSIPASAKGNNGTEADGPFMIEMGGDFDAGRDPFEGTPQQQTAINTVALLLNRFRLDETALRFHNQMTTAKSCPGTSIKRDALVDAVKKARKQLQAAQPRAAVPAGPFGIEANLLYDLLGGRDSARAALHDDGEPPESDAGYTEEASRAMAASDENASERGTAALTPDQLAELLPHVINMREGRYAKSEHFQSDAGTVQGIFADLDARAARATAHDPLRIVLWAHGGLIPEAAGLAIAHKHIWWWRKNDIYPIYFVWETGLGTAIKDTLSRAWARLRGRRGFDIFEHTTDMAVAGLVRSLQGRHVWGGMKHSAAAASQPGNAAHDVATQLGALAAKHGEVIELHALGHSAGSIFHAHFVPAAIAQNARFKSMQFLAPAIRVDEYKEHLDPIIGNGVDAAAIYTMRRSFERADNCAGIYRKSLLYLISHALEGELDAEILGLDESLSADADVARRFGLRGPGTGGAVVWSVTAGASESRTHGGFDDDPATMNSVATSILGAAPGVAYPAAAKRALSMWDFEPEFPDVLMDDLSPEPAFAPQPTPQPTPQAISQWAAHPASIPPAASQSAGRRRALCVGINDYPAAPLNGCVADARSWAAGLRTLGFECDMLLDGQATYDAILRELERLISSSRPGDLLVFQAAGHGMNVTDVDGDEEGGPDEAFCPHDYATGRMLIDDDLGKVLTSIPEGVLLTCFLDYCHSGTSTRLAIGKAEARPGYDERRRFLGATPEVLRLHEQFRAGEASARAVSRAPKRDRESMREVVFSACQPHESAWESNGSGDFTRNVVPLLTRVGITNAQFQEMIISGFNPAGRQQPLLDCSTAARNAVFLIGNTGGATADARHDTGSRINLARLLRQAAAEIESGA